jgi:hypothetical protein
MRWHKDKKTYEKVLYFGVIFTFEFNDWNQVDKKTEDKKVHQWCSFALSMIL